MITFPHVADAFIARTCVSAGDIIAGLSRFPNAVFGSFLSATATGKKGVSTKYHLSAPEPTVKLSHTDTGCESN